MVLFDELKSACILGDINSGKTNLAVCLLKEYKNLGGKREIYIVGYPKQINGFKQITFFNDLFKLTNSIIFIDEIQKYIKIYDRRANYDLMELISLFAHNNNTLIFTTCLSQFISKSIEGYIDCWFLTKILDLKSLKNGSKAKRIIEQTSHPKCSKWSLALLKGEYLEYSELNNPKDNCVKTFEFQGIEKDWCNDIINSDNSQQTKPNMECREVATSHERQHPLQDGKDKTADNPTQNCEENPDKFVQKNATKNIFPEKISKNSERLNSPQEIKGSESEDDLIKRLAWGSGK